MSERPVVRCLAAVTYGEGHIFGDVFHVSLETADRLRQSGYAIVGPDPDDMHALAQWERQQTQKWPWQA